MSTPAVAIRLDEHDETDRGPDEGDQLDDESRARLHAALWRGHEDIKAGRYVDAESIVDESEDDGPP